jgi:hypothetical protein
VSRGCKTVYTPLDRSPGGENSLSSKVLRALSFAAILLCPALAFAQSHSATLSWTPATQSNGITVASWNLLRGATAGGPYTQIANIPVATTSYADTSVSSGQNYFYVVQALDMTGTASVDSTEAEAIIPNSAPPLAVATTSLPPAIAGTSYSVTITASGGTGPYTWSGTGVDALTFSGTGLLSGTPSQTGTFPQSVTVKDSAGATASATLTLTVAAALAISTTQLPTATAGTSYNGTLAATGGTAPYIWSGTGVDGLTLSATGLLSGTPSQTGTFTQGVTVKDSAGAMASASLTLTVSAPPLAVSTASLPPATAGTSYSATITASGGTSPYTWSGTGVDGLTFSGTGLLSGTPSQLGTFTQVLTVKDSTGATASASLTLTVASASGGGTSITLMQHTSKDAGTTSSSTLTFPSNNTASNWIAVSIRAGTANEIFTVTDTNGNTYRKAIQFNLTVSGGTIGIFYAENIAGGANTVTVSDTALATLRFAILEYSGVATSGSLDGVAVTQGNSASPNSGSVTTTANGDLLLGSIMTANAETYTAGIGYRIEESVPAEPGTKLITEDQVQAAAGAAAASATLRVAGTWAAGIAAFKVTGSGGGTAPTITSAGSIMFTVAVAGSFTVTTTGTPIPSLSESGTLPAGVMFTDNGNGSAMLSGTPAFGSGGTYPLTLTATNGVGTPTSQLFTLTVASAPLAISTTQLPAATAGTSYSITLTATGGTAPYTWSGAGVDGLTFSGTGLLSGTPSQAGTFTQGVTVTDSTGATTNASLTLSVAAPVAPVVVSTTSLPPATAGTNYSVTITASGGTGPYTWSGTGVDGLTLSGIGLLSGTLTQAGTFTQGVTVKDSAGATATASLALTVGAPLTVATTSLPAAAAGTSYTATLNASGGTPPYTWSGAGVDGLTFSGTGLLSGTPSQAGTFTQVVAVNDSTGATASASLPLTVAQPAAQPPSAASVTPSNGSGLGSQTFSYLYSDASGYQNIYLVQTILNNTPSWPGSCGTMYIAASSSLYLMSDDGDSWLGPLTIGQPGTLQNSQCTLNAGASSASGSGTNLTVNLAFTFQPGFTDLQNNFMLADDVVNNLSSDLQNRGSWTPAPITGPLAVSVTPSSGSGLGPQTFSYLYSDTSGYQSIYLVQTILNSTANWPGSCGTMYIAASSSLYLISDDGSSWMGPLTIGQAGTLQNSQCTLNAGASSASGSGTNLMVNLALTFQPGFTDLQNNFMLANDVANNLTSGFQKRGSWTPAPITAPLAVSVTPSSGGGSGPQTFSYHYSDTSGYQNIYLVQTILNTTPNWPGSCGTMYIAASSSLYLMSDNGSSWMGPLTIGQPGTLQNSQCTLNVGASSASGSGTTLTVNLALTFQPVFSGSLNNFMLAVDVVDNLTSGFQSRGTWTPSP